MDTLRNPKIFDIAIFDVLATAGAAYAVSWLTSINFFVVFAILLILGVATHYFLGIKTKGNYYLGIGDDPRPG